MFSSILTPFKWVGLADKLTSPFMMKYLQTNQQFPA
jgi:hypothetical protein